MVNQSAYNLNAQYWNNMFSGVPYVLKNILKILKDTGIWKEMLQKDHANKVVSKSNERRTLYHRAAK